MDLNQTGIFIATLRKQSNMTQRELAEKAGVTDKAVSRWENRKRLSGRCFVAIARRGVMYINIGVSNGREN